MSDSSSQKPTIIAATRLHLGKAKSPPSQEDLDAKVANFASFCSESCQAAVGVLAVDATPKIDGYDLVQAVQTACSRTNPQTTKLHVLPVMPWGKFVPALNACIVFAANHECKAEWILFVSAETSAPKAAMETLYSHMLSSPGVLMSGARLQGHNYQKGTTGVSLSGTTCPWNTLCVWDLKKLARTGFQLVSDGLVTNDQTEPSFGVEEVVAVALLQKLLGTDNAKAKLVELAGVDWDQVFEDPERKKWHEEKMKSKEIRAERQLKLMGLSGTVDHV